LKHQKYFLLTLIFAPFVVVAISHASTVPGTITHRQGTAGQTAIIFPESRTQAQTHVHALSQMVSFSDIHQSYY
jgi:hypothetical protein